jgi:type IV pilus assembly protein PilE
MTNRSSFSSSRMGGPRSGGFTLVELMITVVILAIIVAIALPSYQAQTQKARRTDARNALLDIAGREERFLSVSNAYSQLPSDVGYGGGAWPQNVTPNSYYSVTVTVPAPGFPAGTPSFLVSATPINVQASDTTCATFTVNQIGQQTAQNAGGVDTSATCWGS